MSAAWPTVSLGDLVRLERRPVEVIADREYKEIGTYSYGRGIFHKRPRSGLEVGDKDLFLMKEGDLILQVTFAWEGAIALCSEAEDGLYGSVRYPTFRVEESRCFAPFLARYLCTRQGLEQINRICPGSAGRNRVLALKCLPEINVPLPPLDEQRRIVARIEELAAKVAEAARLRQLASQETEAFIVSMHAAMSDAAPEPLANYIELHEDAVQIEAGTPYPQAGVRGFGGGLFGKPPVIGGQTTYRAFNRLYPGALVMSQVKGWEGALAMTPPALTDYFVSPEYRTFRCRPDRCLPEYLAAIVPTEYFWGRLKEATRGVGARRERTRPEQFLQLEFSMPSISDQRRGLNMFASVRSVQSLQDESATELDAMLPAILDKAFKGELG
ncbi:MAG: restriction endonuclease subunit S [Hyphomicrobium sp.]|uniref:restriction endonuclease subunit S n=1 Tax=Hyphomicrobium sp. TaxID=82 RepID=UPI003D13C99A